MSLEASFNIEKYRAAFSGRIGEIIEDVIGDKRIREMFDEAGKHPDEHAGKPTGIIALEMGVISPEVKTALLVAQAAERTARLADKALKIRNPGTPMTFEDQKEAGYLSMDDPVFKYVGSERDPQELRFAQGVWQIAQANLNAEIKAANPDIISYSPGIKTAHSLKAAAGTLYFCAADLMQKAGMDDIAKRLTKVCYNVMKDVPEDLNLLDPSDIARTLKQNEIDAAEQENMYRQRQSESYSVAPSAAFIGTMDKLSDLTKTQAPKELKERKPKP